jgi:hypothetical protein
MKITSGLLRHQRFAIRGLAAALLLGNLGYTDRAWCAEPCYLRVTNRMEQPMTLSLEGRDVAWTKARQRAIEAGAWDLRDRGEIVRATIAEPMKRVPPELAIPPGAATAWLDLGPFLLDARRIELLKTKGKIASLNEGYRAFRLTVRGLDGSSPTTGRLTLQLSRLPEERPYFERLVERDSPSFILIVPGEGYRQQAMLDEEASSLVLGYLKGLDLPGSPPTRFYPHFGKYQAQGLSSRVQQLENEIVHLLGDNARYHSLHLYGENGVKSNRIDQEAALKKLPSFWPRRQQELQVDIPAAVAAGEPVAIPLTCEPNLKPQDDAFLRNDPEERQLFREYLKAQGLKPQDFGWQSWDEARMQYRGDPGELNPVVFWHSMQFRAARVGQFFAQTTQAVEQLTRGLPGAQPNRIWITPFYSMGHVLIGGYGSGIFRQGADWWTIERARGGNCVRTEDYLLADADKRWLSHQVQAYCVDFLWSVAHQQHEAMVFDICAGGASATLPAELRWRLYAALGRGVRAIDHEYHGAPYIQNTFCMQDHLSTLAELARTYRRIATVEDLLADAQRPDAPVAILMSQAAELWAGWPDTPTRMEDQFLVERQLLYYALRHRGLAVEMIDEGAILQGGLDRYRAIYLCGKHVRRACAEKIRDWVEQGGMLYSECASGLLDEYNHPDGTLLEVYGLKSAQTEGKARGGAIRPLLDALRQPGAKPVDSVTVKETELTFPAWDIVARLEPKPDARVLATFHDGTPALVSAQYGRGRCLVSGAMPGLEYARKAIEKKVRFGDLVPLEPSGKKLVAQYPFYFHDDPVEFADHTIAVGFSKPLRDLMCLPVEWAKIAPQLTISRDVVDAMLLAAPKGAVVTLVNYLVEPIANLEVLLTLEPGERVQSVWSTERLAEVPFVQQGNHVTLRIDLGLAEMLGLRFK